MGDSGMRMWNAPALRMKVRMTGTMRERNRDSSARRVTRHTWGLAESYKAYAEAGIERVTRHTLRLASNKQYGVEVSKKEKWTRGNDSLFIVVPPVCSIPIPMAFVVSIISHIFYLALCSVLYINLCAPVVVSSHPTLSPGISLPTSVICRLRINIK